MLLIHIKRSTSMKKILLIIGVIISFEYSIQAQDSNVDSKFDSASIAYSEQSFLTAIDFYNQIVDAGFKSPELFFNLGNAYFKIGQYPRAILNYEKAALLDPNDDDIQFNILKASAYTIDKIEMIPEFFLIGWIRSFVSVLSSNQWAIVALVSFVFSLLLLFLFFILITRSKKVLVFTIGIILMLTTILSFIFAVKTKNYINNSNQAIVLTSTVTVKGAPDSNGINVFIIHEGTKINLLRSIGDWYEIRIADGKQGWLLNTDFEKI